LPIQEVWTLKEPYLLSKPLSSENIGTFELWETLENTSEDGLVSLTPSCMGTCGWFICAVNEKPVLLFS
jgi:hypothetical protein